MFMFQYSPGNTVNNATDFYTSFVLPPVIDVDLHRLFLAARFGQHCLYDYNDGQQHNYNGKFDFIFFHDFPFIFQTLPIR